MAARGDATRDNRARGRAGPDAGPAGEEKQIKKDEGGKNTREGRMV